jgi:hypothetical protein
MRTLFGSNVDRVLRQALCPVLVARPLKPAMPENLARELNNIVVQTAALFDSRVCLRLQAVC